MSKGCRVLYLYQVERLPLMLSGLEVEKAGSSNDCILWQVPVLDIVQGHIQDFSKGFPSLTMNVLLE